MHPLQLRDLLLYQVSPSRVLLCVAYCSGSKRTLCIYVHIKHQPMFNTGHQFPTSGSVTVTGFWILYNTWQPYFVTYTKWNCLKKPKEKSKSKSICLRSYQTSSDMHISGILMKIHGHTMTINLWRSVMRSLDVIPWKVRDTSMNKWGWRNSDSIFHRVIKEERTVVLPLVLSTHRIRITYLKSIPKCARIRTLVHVFPFRLALKRSFSVAKILALLYLQNKTLQGIHFVGASTFI